MALCLLFYFHVKYVTDNNDIVWASLFILEYNP